MSLLDSGWDECFASTYSGYGLCLGPLVLPHTSDSWLSNLFPPRTLGHFAAAWIWGGD